MFSRTRTASLQVDDGRGAWPLAELREAVTSALVEVLGSAGAKVTMNYVGFSETVDAKRMHTKLVELFGAGAASLEIAMLTKFYEKLGMKFAPDGSRSFADYVTDGKRLSGKGQPAVTHETAEGQAAGWRLFRR